RSIKSSKTLTTSVVFATLTFAVRSWTRQARPPSFHRRGQVLPGRQFAPSTQYLARAGKHDHLKGRRGWHVQFSRNRSVEIENGMAILASISVQIFCGVALL